MKQLIIPIAIIATLIAFFIVADRREFNRTDDVQTVQNESATINRKPFVSAPQAKPPTEAKLVEFSFNENIDRQTDRQTGRQTGVKPAETKSDAETKPAAETKSEAKPAAVPVATPEEAEKHNEDAKAYALAEKDRKEPFFKFYEDSKFDSVCFQGTVRATSTIPDPEKNDYDNCLYALFIEIDSLLSDATAETKIACEAIVNVPIMRNKTIFSDNMFLPGDKIWCSCVEYDEMPQAIQEIQLSDDIQSYEHQQYYPFGIKKISAFQNGGNRNFAKREITILPIQSLPRDEKAAALRKERIQNEIVRIEEEIKKHGGSFEKWKEEYKPIAEKYKELSKKEWSGWINDCFFAAGGAETAYSTKEYIAGILPYKKYLEQNNIDLIVVRYPSKWDFAARVLGADSFQENPAWIEHYYECLKNDIEIVDPMPEMWKHRFDYTEFYYYQVPEEIHPFDGYAFVSAQILSSCLKRYSLKEDPDLYSLKDDNVNASSRKDYYPDGNNRFDPGSPMTLKSVYKEGSSIFCKDISGSPILVISNSLFQFPSRWKGAGFPEYLAYHLRLMPDFICQQGQTNSMLRSLISNPTVLTKRAAVIMPGGYFMWNGFPPFPKYLFDNPKQIELEQTIDFSEGENKVLSIQGVDHFKISYEDGLNIKKTDQQTSFSLSFTIPTVPDKQVCMIRVIFKSYDRTAITVKNSEDNSIIEPECEADGFLKKSDLFVPISDKSKDICLVFRLIDATSITIDKFELWYY